MTRSFKDLTVINDAAIGKERIDRVGILLSFDIRDVQSYGIIVDSGTTDGFQALPLTLQSTQFYIAAWKSVAILAFYIGYLLFTVRIANVYV